MIGIVLVQESIGNTHQAVVIARNLTGLADLDRVEIIVAGVLGRGVCFVERKFFMAIRVVHIGVPPNALDPNEFIAFLINTVACCLKGVVIRHAKFSITAMNALAQPKCSILNQLEYLLIVERIHVPDDKKLLLVLDQLLNVFAEQGEGWIGDDNIRLLE